MGRDEEMKSDRRLKKEKEIVIFLREKAG